MGYNYGIKRTTWRYGKCAGFTKGFSLIEMKQLLPICSMVLEYVPSFALNIAQFCRYIYHTWSIWVIVILISKSDVYLFENTNRQKNDSTKESYILTRRNEDSAQIYGVLEDQPLVNWCVRLELWDKHRGHLIRF